MGWGEDEARGWEGGVTAAAVWQGAGGRAGVAEKGPDWVVGEGWAWGVVGAALGARDWAWGAEEGAVVVGGGHSGGLPAKAAGNTGGQRRVRPQTPGQLFNDAVHCIPWAGWLGGWWKGAGARAWWEG